MRHWMPLRWNLERGMLCPGYDDAAFEGMINGIYAEKNPVWAADPSARTGFSFFRPCC